jgi:DNA-binding GntR family transcriptional regulator
MVLSFHAEWAQAPVSGQAVALAAPLRMQVIELLREAILSSEYKPGDRLVECDLCDRCGVSRTVIREALRHLEAEGLVEIVPNRGPVVSSLGIEDARGLYEVREAVEGLAAKLAAQRATPAQRLALGRALKRVESAYRRGNLREEVAAKDEFYEAMFAAAGNPVVPNVLRPLHARMQMLRGLSLQSPGRTDESLAELRKIVEAIDAGDGAAAQEIACEHVRLAAEVALARFEELEASTLDKPATDGSDA